MAAYTPYDALRIIVSKLAWQQESQFRPILESIDEWERLGVFGSVATWECTHENIEPRPPFKCLDCGRLNP